MTINKNNLPHRYKLGFFSILMIAIVQIGCGQASSPPADTSATPPSESTTSEKEETESEKEEVESSAAESVTHGSTSSAQTEPPAQSPKDESASGDGDFHGLEPGAVVDFSQGYSDSDLGSNGLTETVQFAPGTASATLSAAVARGTTNQYYLGARGGQAMEVNLTSTESNGVFALYLKDGNLWRPFHDAAPGADATGWSGTLPGSTPIDLLVVVGATRGGASYDLFIGIE